MGLAAESCSRIWLPCFNNNNNNNKIRLNKIIVDKQLYENLVCSVLLRILVFMSTYVIFFLQIAT